MNKIIYIIISFILLSNCTANKLTKHHGVPFLSNKQELLIVNKTNSNDIKKILGKPSTISKFDKDVWIYIDRELTQSNLKNLGKMKVVKNDVLVLEINNLGILEKKKFYNINDMNKIEINENITKIDYKKNSFIYAFLSSMRQKINDPLGSRAKKRKEISQR